MDHSEEAKLSHAKCFILHAILKTGFTFCPTESQRVLSNISFLPYINQLLRNIYVNVSLRYHRKIIIVYDYDGDYDNFLFRVLQQIVIVMAKINSTKYHKGREGCGQRVTNRKYHK